jgi:beta-D-xylosidase 4
MSKGAPRLGLPPYAWWNEALHGVALSPGVTFNPLGSDFSNATSFANTITLAAAFDDDLVYQVASAISTEARAFANAGLAGLDYWSPNINPYKDPRWGRGHEVTPRQESLYTVERGRLTIPTRPQAKTLFASRAMSGRSSPAWRATVPSGRS